MFVRKKKNRSSSISVVVVDKSNGMFKEIQCLGSSKSESEIAALYLKARLWIEEYGGQQLLDFTEPDLKMQEAIETERILSKVDSVQINGTQLLLNRIYDHIGFNRIEDDILRHLVIARISQPASKLATVASLKSYYDEDLELNWIYKYMDKLYATRRELIQQISVEHTLKILGGRIGIVFYDVTTLYFETGRQDILRQPGFSKDGKNKESQIVLGLLVSAGGYPLSYSIFCGSQYEGRTLIPVIDDFIQRFSLIDFVIVADSGLMNKKKCRTITKGSLQVYNRYKN
jgi:transposase